MSLPSQLDSPASPADASLESPPVLLIAWEYPGAHSRRGTALSRRVGQVARGLARLGWSVTVVHRLQREDDPARGVVAREVGPGGSLVRRLAIPGPSAESRLPRWMAPVRKLSTLWTAIAFGDRSGRWASHAVRAIAAADVPAPAVVLAFFTPRGPLAAASALHRKHQVPWLADFQDPWWEGTSRWLRPVVARWMRNTLRSASVVVQVSPEWAAEDAAVLRRALNVVRHAVPTSDSDDRGDHRPSGTGPFRILYVGSLNPDQQDVGAFMDALALVQQDAAERGVEVQIAGGEESWSIFERSAAARGIPAAVRWLGWLDAAALRRAMATADCLLLVPMFPAHRRGVPSKLFEYLAYDTPVLIAGPDSGGMRSLLEEWAHPPVVAQTAAEIASAIRRARDGDASALLQRHRCGIEPVTDETLATWYSEQMHRVVCAARAH